MSHTTLCRAGAADARGCSSATTPAWPRLVAHKRGVWPYISGLSGLISSCPSSISTTLPCPFLVAHKSGVWPKLSGSPELTSSLPSIIFTTPTCPPERGFTGLILFVKVNVVPPEEYFHNSLMTILKSPAERRSAVLN